MMRNGYANNRFINYLQSLTVQRVSNIKNGIVGICRISTLMFSSSDSQAQEYSASTSAYHFSFFQRASLVGGLGATYSRELQSPGLNSRFYYNINKRLCLGPELSYLRAKESKLMDANLVLHCIFETKWLGIYPLVGLNYSRDTKTNGMEDSGFGSLWGAGIHRNFRKLTFFVEYSFIESKLRDQFLTFGFLPVITRF